MTNSEIRDKILEGSNLALRNLILRKRKEGGSLVIMRDGKVATVPATDIPLPGGEEPALPS